MKVVEIRNNLVKLGLEQGENLILGRFVVLASGVKSYVAQVINLKSDNIQKLAIAKLMFTFTEDGVVDSYDGSAPDVNSEVSNLPSQELLDLLPVETPFKLGHLAQQDAVLNVDISIFEHNFTIFADHDFEKYTFISNCLNQLSEMNEKTVVIDNSNIFENQPKLVLGKDFKLPLNSNMIDFIFDYGLGEIEVETKAVIKDIFYAVQQYINTLSDRFLPIDKFVEVVASQYQQNPMPELALLKNKLLKYRDMGIFANSKNEINVISRLLGEQNALIIDLKDIEPKLQNRVLNIIYDELNYYDGYVYFFLTLDDENSDKQLIRKMINHGHVFTAIFSNHQYKYAAELKEHAQNIALYAPQTISHEFSSYNTFLNKLNQDEFIIYGKLTQGIPFIVESEIVDSGRQQADLIMSEMMKEEANEPVYEISEDDNDSDINFGSKELSEESIHSGVSEDNSLNPAVIPPIENIMESDDLEISESDISENNESEYIEAPDISEITSKLQEPVYKEDEDSYLSDEDLDFIDESTTKGTDEVSQGEDFPEITEEDLYDSELQDSTPVVPVYPAEGISENTSDVGDIGFEQGDVVTHPRYGRGVIEKVIKYGNKTLCSINFDNVGRRLLDPSISEFEKE